MTVNIRPSVLESDEAIVCVFRHEMYELENLAQMAEEATMTNRDVNAHTTPEVRHNLHDQAWDVADLEVLMRERPGSSKHAELVERRESLLARFELQNHGSPE